jgi:hypothetical protein
LMLIIPPSPAIFSISADTNISHEPLFFTGIISVILIIRGYTGDWLSLRYRAR